MAFWAQNAVFWAKIAGFWPKMGLKIFCKIFEKYFCEKFFGRSSTKSPSQPKVLCFFELARGHFVDSYHIMI